MFRALVSMLGLIFTLSPAEAVGPSGQAVPSSSTYLAAYSIVSGIGFGGLLIQAGQATDVALANDPAAPGRHVIRVQIHKNNDFLKVANGAPRSEFTLPRNVYMSPGQEYLIRWQTYLPRDFAFDRQQMEIITQIHQSESSGPPPFMLTVLGEDYTFSVRGGLNTEHGSGGRVCCARSDLGRWVNWTLQYAPDASGREAVTRLWKSGKLVLDGNGMANAYLGDRRAYLKFGIYKPGWLKQLSDVDALELYFGDMSVFARTVHR
ncbi:polysaccharide lyase-like protein [Paraburkholderia sp. BL27I4N3]|nr:polysaccharide lyase-like protein [Paraburkholderia sp. BL27I4N3]